MDLQINVWIYFYKKVKEMISGENRSRESLVYLSGFWFLTRNCFWGIRHNISYLFQVTAAQAVHPSSLFAGSDRRRFAASRQQKIDLVKYTLRFSLQITQHNLLGHCWYHFFEMSTFT